MHTEIQARVRVGFWLIRLQSFILYLNLEHKEQGGRTLHMLDYFNQVESVQMQYYYYIYPYMSGEKI